MKLKGGIEFSNSEYFKLSYCKYSILLISTNKKGTENGLFLKKGRIQIRYKKLAGSS